MQLLERLGLAPFAFENRTQAPARFVIRGLVGKDPPQFLHRGSVASGGSIHVRQRQPSLRLLRIDRERGGHRLLGPRHPHTIIGQRVLADERRAETGLGDGELRIDGNRPLQAFDRAVHRLGIGPLEQRHAPPVGFERFLVAGRVNRQLMSLHIRHGNAESIHQPIGQLPLNGKKISDSVASQSPAQTIVPSGLIALASMRNRSPARCRLPCTSRLTPSSRASLGGSEIVRADSRVVSRDTTDTEDSLDRLVVRASAIPTPKGKLSASWPVRLASGSTAMIGRAALPAGGLRQFLLGTRRTEARSRRRPRQTSGA